MNDGSEAREADATATEAAMAAEAVQRAEQDLQLARDRMLQVRAAEKDEQQREFDIQKAKAEAEIGEARGERANVREQIAEAYASQAEAERSSKALSDEIWQAQQERVAEDLMFKKLRLEKVQEKRKQLSGQLQEKQGQLGSLAAELSRRDVQSDALLQDALRHADVLREALNEAEQDGVSLQQMWMRQHGSADRGDAPGVAREFNMVDELLAFRQQKLRKEARVKADALRSLNTERRELSDRRHETAKRRREMERLMAKGKEFLAEIELGEAPPLEFIKLNVKVAPREDLAANTSAQSSAGGPRVSFLEGSGEDGSQPEPEPEPEQEPNGEQEQRGHPVDDDPVRPCTLAQRCPPTFVPISTLCLEKATHPPS
jgi:hypothetical protein